MPSVTFSDYLKLLRDRPEKFKPSQVNYVKARGVERCARCLHFYRSSQALRSVCEIMRPSGDESVDPAYVCDFFTRDGKLYPLLEQKNLR